jgi:hypothetical protein
VDHDLEALEVGEVGAEASLDQLLGNGGIGPLGGEIGFLASSDQGASASSFLNVKLHSGERQSLERVNHSGEVLSINENSVGVSNIHDGDLLSVVHSEVNERNSAGFHEVFVSLHEKKEELGKVTKEMSPNRTQTIIRLSTATTGASESTGVSLANLPFLLLYYYIK